MNRSFGDLLVSVRGVDWTPPNCILAIDPGETVGWSLFRKGALAEYGQISIPTFKDGSLEARDLWSLFDRTQPDVAVIEGYRVYASKAKYHTWSALYTPKLIGYVEAICQSRNIPYHLQMASTRMFCTNEKLKAWGYYPTGKGHAADAIRHGCYWLLFHDRRRKSLNV